MKFLALLISMACLLTGCAHRGIPPEVTALRYMQPKPLPVHKREVIIVDAGHGGKDEGAASKKECYLEKELTLETAFLISDHLKKLGYKTVMTRKQDVFVPLETRAEIANSLDADLFVSIHYNFSTSKEVEGIEVFYYKEGKTPASSRVAKSKVLGQEVLKTIVAESGAASRGLKQANFAVIRETKMPAILVEAGFLSNPKERAKIHKAEYRESLAKGIAEGIDQYLSSKR